MIRYTYELPIEDAQASERSGTVHLKSISLVILMITCTTLGNVLMKFGADAPHDQRLFGLLGWQSVLGISIFAGSVLLYAKLLEYLPLNVVQSFAALQFVTVVMTSFLFFGETISVLRWAGISSIALGIFIVASTA